MSFLSRKLFYAVEAVVTIAYHSGYGAVSGRAIAQRQGLPPRYLEQLMQCLVRGGILRGIRGPHGGYVLAKERRNITIADIYNALDEGKEETDQKNYIVTPLGQHIIRPQWDRFAEVMLEHLGEINLADLCAQAEEKQIRKNVDEKADFNI